METPTQTFRRITISSTVSFHHDKTIFQCVEMVNSQITKFLIFILAFHLEKNDMSNMIVKESYDSSGINIHTQI